MLLAILALPLLVCQLSAAPVWLNIPLTTFDGAEGTTQHWHAVNDPVMGGQSTAMFTVDRVEKAGIFEGEVKIVPFLHAPGFATMKTTGAHFPDASAANALQLVARSSIAYNSFKAEFGPAPGGLMSRFHTYKADFNVSVSSDWQEIVIPFKAFSRKWSDTTGEPTVRCSNDSSVCPDAEHLAKLTTLEIAAEGGAGKFHLEVKSISAVRTVLAASPPCHRVDSDGLTCTQSEKEDSCAASYAHYKDGACSVESFGYCFKGAFGTELWAKGDGKSCAEALHVLTKTGYQNDGCGGKSKPLPCTSSEAAIFTV